MYGYIYKTTNLINGKIYIGQKHYKKWKEKFDASYLGSGIYLKRAINLYGKNNFKVELIEEVATKEELNEKEIYWISYYNATNSLIGYNIASGGQGGDLGEVCNKKISEKLKGKNNWSKGRVTLNNNEIEIHVNSSEVNDYLSKGWVKGKLMTENVLNGLKRAHERLTSKSEQEKQNIIQKQRQSLKNSLQKRTVEEKKLIGEHISKGRYSSEKCKSSWNKNIPAKNWQTEQHKIHLLEAISKPKTKEHRDKLSKTRKSNGVAKGAKNPNAKAVMCVSTGEVFSWAGEAAEKLGLNVKEIRKCCQGTRKHINGLIFKYMESNIC